MKLASGNSATFNLIDLTAVGVLHISAAFGGFFGSPILGAVYAVEYMFIKELNFYRHLIPGLIAGLWVMVSTLRFYTRHF